MSETRHRDIGVNEWYSINETGDSLGPALVAMHPPGEGAVERGPHGPFSQKVRSV
jgi:hypothetical protein